MAVPPYVVTGTTATSTWANQVANALVNPFASTGARSSGITSPTAGQLVVLTANDSTEGIEIYSSAGSWRKPWNMPWGFIGAYSATAFTYNTGSGSSASMAVPMVDNRKYRLDVRISVNTGSASGSVDTWALYDNTASTKIADFAALDITSGTALIIPGMASYDSLATGTRNIGVQGIGTASANTRSVTTVLYVYDEGPNGAPV